jgi:hypothetical protein
MKNPEMEQELSQDELLRRFVKMFPIEARFEASRQSSCSQA